MENKDLLLEIHNQCGALQQMISVHYDKPCAEIAREVSYLSSLLVAYIVRNP